MIKPEDIAKIREKVVYFDTFEVSRLRMDIFNISHFDHREEQEKVLFTGNAHEVAKWLNTYFELKG